MPHGLQVSGAHGSIQIDQDYSHLVRIASGSANKTTGGTSGDTCAIGLPYQNGYVPQIFIRPWADGTYVGGLQWNSPSCTIASLYCTGGFDWVAYGIVNPELIDGSGYGLQVFKGDGSLALDSRTELARIQQTVLVSQSNDGFGGTDYPQNYNFTGWGLRPWLGVNCTGVAYYADTVLAYMITTGGTAGFTIHLAQGVTGAPYNDTIVGWIYNRFYGPNRPFGGFAVDVPVLRRYLD